MVTFQHCIGFNRFHPVGHRKGDVGVLIFAQGFNVLRQIYRKGLNAIICANRLDPNFNLFPQDMLKLSPIRPELQSYVEVPRQVGEDGFLRRVLRLGG